MVKILTQKMLKNLLNIFKFFKRSKVNLLPSEFADTEKIARSVFSPVNVTKSEKLRTNTFKSPANIDEVSINRLDYTNANHLKKLSKNIENPPRRSYFGFAMLLKSEIYNCNAELKYSPILEPKDKINPFHSDIKVGYIKEKGKEFPAEINYKIDKLITACRFYKDPNPSTDNWTGKELL